MKTKKILFCNMVYFRIFLPVLLLCPFVVSCSDNVDTFDIISETKYVVDKNIDSIFYIYTKNNNFISKIIVNSESVDIYGMQRDRYVLENMNNEELKISYFYKSPMMDNAEIKSVESSFFRIEKQDSREPEYKVDIKKSNINIRRVELILASRVYEKRIIFNYN